MDKDHELRERLVALTRDLILMPSTVHRPSDRAQCLAFLRNHLEGLEEVDLSEHDCQGNLSLLALPKGITEPEILLCGHLDVIGHPDVSVYRSEVRDGRIYGPGAGDMKGPLAILVEVFQKAHSQPGKIPSLGLLITSDEETGGACGVQYMFEEVGLRCKAAMIPDGGSPSEITTDEKGVLHLEVRCKGHAAHAARPWLGRNALEYLVEGISNVQNKFASFPRGDDTWYPTCTLTILHTPNDTSNRIPSEATAVLDIRFPPPHSVAQMMSLVQAELGHEISTRELLSAEPVHLSPDPLYVELSRDVMGVEPQLVKEPGGSDGRFICSYGIPVMMSRPLVGEIHTEEEWIDIESMVQFCTLYETYLWRRLYL